MIDRAKFEELFNARRRAPRRLYDDEFLRFERVESKLSARSDMHALLLLDQLAPGARDIIRVAEHGVIYLNVDLDVLCKNATEAHIIDLKRCGVYYDDDDDSLVLAISL